MAHICPTCIWHGECGDEIEADISSTPIENCGDYKKA
jgi:hypothetical protein